MKELEIQVQGRQYSGMDQKEHSQETMVAIYPQTEELENDMISRPKLVWIGYTVVNALIAMTASLHIAEELQFRCRISSQYLSLCFYSLFLVIPIAAISLWLLNRKCRKNISRATDVYFGVSRVLFTMAWLVSCLPIALIIAIAQPWPLSLRQGPDTDYARQGFERFVGFAPPSSVTDIYYRSEFYPSQDIDGKLRFTCRDSTVVTQIIQQLQLQASGEDSWGVGSTNADWWGAKPSKKFFAGERRHRYCHLWYDPDSGIVLYTEFSR